MVHGRIETTPQEQLEELRRAHARYIRLADELKDESDSETDLEERKAREEDARRIAQAYERTIANTAARIASLEQARAGGTPFIGWGMMLGLGMAVAAAAGVGLLAFLHPAIFHIGPAQPKPVGQIASGAVPVDRSQADAFVAPEPEGPSKTNAIASSAPKPSPPDNAKHDIRTAKAAIAPKSDVPPQVPPLGAAIPQAGPPSRDLTQPLSAPTTPASDAQAASPPSIAVTTALPLPDVAQAPPPSASQPPSSIVPQTPATPINSGTPTDSSLPVGAATPSPPGATQAPPGTTQAPPASIVPETPVQTQTLPPIAAAAPPRQQPNPASQTPLQLEPVRNTHVPPPYPATSLRLGEQGTTRMRVSISTRGLVTGCKVTNSSGSGRLDMAACGYVQQRWRWKPPMRGGRPVAADTEISVIWRLRRVP